jgi:hypothetical protein
MFMIVHEQVTSNPRITQPSHPSQDLINPSKSRTLASQPDSRTAAAEQRQKEVCSGLPCPLVTRLTDSPPPGQNASWGTGAANPNHRIAAQLEVPKSKASPKDSGNKQDERLMVSTSLLDKKLSLFTDSWRLVGLS